MTGYRSRHFRWHCEDKGCYHEQLPNWDDLIECFPRGIKPTDIDGMVELNRHFLFLEQKSPGKSIDTGQGMALRGLCLLPDVTAVIFRPAAMSDLECLVYGTGGALLPGWEPHDGFKPHSRNEFYAWLHEWSFQASEKRPGKIQGGALCPGSASMTSFPFTARLMACRMLHTAFTPRRSSGARGTSQTVSCPKTISTA